MLILSSPFQDPYGWLVNLINKVCTTLYIFVHSSSYKSCDDIFLNAKYYIMHNYSQIIMYYVNSRRHVDSGKIRAPDGISESTCLLEFT